MKVKTENEGTGDTAYFSVVIVLSISTIKDKILHKSLSCSLEAKLQQNTDL